MQTSPRVLFVTCTIFKDKQLVASKNYASKWLPTVLHITTIECWNKQKGGVDSVHLWNQFRFLNGGKNRIAKTEKKQKSRNNLHVPNRNINVSTWMTRVCCSKYMLRSHQRHWSTTKKKNTYWPLYHEAKSQPCEWITYVCLLNHPRG